MALDPTVSHPAQALVAEWVGHLEHGRRVSPHTLRAYTATAYNFLGFLGPHLGRRIDGGALQGLTLADFRAYLAARRGDGLANVSVAREVSAINPRAVSFCWIRLLFTRDSRPSKTFIGR